MRAQQSSILASGFSLATDTSYQTKFGNEYYDEVSVTLFVPRIGNTELQSIIFQDQLYIPVKDFFDFLKIKNTVSPDFDLIQGFFIYEDDHYYIDQTNNRIIFRDKTFELRKYDLLLTETNLFLRAELFGEVFGLDCHFDFRALSVTLHTKLELPAIREMKQELMRKNISKLQGEKKADTTIKRSFPLFNIGSADWTVNSSQESTGLSNARFNLAIGAIVAGGETNISLNYFKDHPLRLRDQYYLWRFVNNDIKAVRQVSIGKIYPSAVSTLFAPVIGIQFTNTPSTYRKSFGTFTLSNQTEPGWSVELYVNNVLINYTKADASGFYTFEVPMVYGNSLVKLRFYGPWGEEQVSEKYISVPFNFIPVNQLEYTVTSGIVEDNESAKFTRVNIGYGLARRLTIGGGAEYLSTALNGKIMPYLQASMVVGSHLLVSGEYTAGVRGKLSFNYRLPSNVQVDITYIKYAAGQNAIRVNHTEEKKIVLSVPIRSGNFNAFSRLSLHQFTFPFNEISAVKNTSRYTSVEYLLSSTFSGITSNLTNYAVFNNNENPLVYSNLSFTFRLPKGLRLTQQSQYEWRQRKFSMLKAGIEMNLFSRAFISLSYQEDFFNRNNSVMTLGFRYNFSFAQTFFTASKTKKSVIATQSATGSLMFDPLSKYIGTGNQSHTGRGGVLIIPFLDMNCNGIKDKNEPRVAGMKLHVNGGRINYNAKDTLIRISGLEAYASYYLEIDKNSFDNIAWQLKATVIKVMVDPNHFKHIEIPVSVVGEINGFVFLKKGSDVSGLGRIVLNIFDSHSNFIAKVLTEEDGFFSYIGLAPGEYSIALDENQLNKLEMKGSAPARFKIKADVNGDVAGDLKFVIEKNNVY